MNASASCSNVSSTTVNCTNVASGSSVYYTLISPDGASDYTQYTLTATTNTSVDATNITLVNIPPHEIFYTLVEYGRGRGNYFYATTSKAKGLNLTESYIPEGADIELSFLHKVINIGRYINLPSETATEANFSCEYPNNTVIRQHNIDTIHRLVVLGISVTISMKLRQLGKGWAIYPCK